MSNEQNSNRLLKARVKGLHPCPVCGEVYVDELGREWGLVAAGDATTSEREKQ